MEQKATQGFRYRIRLAWLIDRHSSPNPPITFLKSHIAPSFHQRRTRAAINTALWLHYRTKNDKGLKAAFRRPYLPKFKRERSSRIDANRKLAIVYIIGHTQTWPSLEQPQLWLLLAAATAAIERKAAEATDPETAELIVAITAEHSSGEWIVVGTSLVNWLKLLGASCKSNSKN